MSSRALDDPAVADVDRETLSEGLNAAERLVRLAYRHEISLSKNWWDGASRFELVIDAEHFEILGGGTHTTFRLPRLYAELGRRAYVLSRSGPATGKGIAWYVVETKLQLLG